MVIDLEVENNTLFKRKASPFDERNYVVQIGWSVNGGTPQEKYYEQWHREPVLPCLDGIDLLVYHNAKFDLLWTWKEPEMIKFLKRGGTVFCTQYAEYLLGGMTQEHQMTSMNEIAGKYGGGLKIDAVKEMWENGVLTSQIPRGLLTDYLIGDGKEIVGDIMNTWLIYCGQVKRIKAEMAPEFIPMIKARMDGLLATTEMEYNGLHIDREVAEENRLALVRDLAEADKELQSYIPELPPELEFNWGSIYHKSYLIYGGVAKYKKWCAHTDENGDVLYAKKKIQVPMVYEDGEPVTYKTGKNAGLQKFKTVTVDDTDKPKGALKDHYFQFPGYVKPKAKWQSELKDAYGNPLYSTSGEVVSELAKMGLPFTNALGDFTSKTKDLGTYYYTIDKNGRRKGMLCLVDDAGIIHHSLNHTSTVTSRLSSRDPNMQNIPRGDTSDVKKMFTSRFKGGKMAEIDYSQLEVVVQGMLTKDKQLTDDLLNKVDFHCKRLAAKLGRNYDEIWKLHHVDKDPEIGVGRTNAKGFSFQRAYGAGAAAIADATGMHIDEVKALIEAEEQLYPTVKAFDVMLERAINASRVPTSEKLYIDGVAFTRGKGHWDSPTGTRYVWKEGIAPAFMHEKGKYTGFSPTERKNYYVQGTGGEIVQTMLGKVFRHFVANDFFGGEVLMVNTVHDCMLLDGKEHLIEKVAKECQAILEDVPNTYNAMFPKLGCVVPFPCETEIGYDLFDMEKLH